MDRRRNAKATSTTEDTERTEKNEGKSKLPERGTERGARGLGVIEDGSAGVVGPSSRHR